MKANKKYRFGFDLGHPAHYHLFKHFIDYLIRQGHYVYIHARDKDILLDLLTYARLEHTISFSKSHKSLLFAFLKHFISYYSFSKYNNIDYHVGTSVVIGLVSKISKTLSFGFSEDNFSTSKYQYLLGYKFCDKYFKPINFAYELKSKSYLYPSYHELAYLHPNIFIPNENILKKYSLKKKEYIIIRFSSLSAHHDKNAEGISDKLLFIIKNVIKNYQLIESVENNKNYQIEPWDMHHILFFAKMLISDSQTMTIEGAVLGVPSIRINTFADKSKVITELDKYYNLSFSYYPNQLSGILSSIKYIIETPSIENVWNYRRKRLLADKCDFNKWLIKYFQLHFGI